MAPGPLKVTLLKTGEGGSNRRIQRYFFCHVSTRTDIHSISPTHEGTDRTAGAPVWAQSSPAPLLNRFKSRPGRTSVATSFRLLYIEQLVEQLGRHRQLSSMALGWAMAALVLVYFFHCSAAGPCDDYNCVQGKCVEVNGIPPVKCVCDDGWSNVLSLSFLSCAIPNCNFNLHCNNSSTSTATDHTPSLLKDFDIFNPCTYSICGEGDCVEQNKSSLVHSYTCQCHPGYVNLLNQSAGVCVSDCNIGANCSQLGIALSPSASPSTGKNGSSTLSDVNSSARILPSIWTLLVAGGLINSLF